MTMNILITLFIVLNASGLIKCYNKLNNQENWTSYKLLEESFMQTLNDTNKKQMLENELFKSLDFIAKHNKQYENGFLSHRLAANHFLGRAEKELPKIDINKNFSSGSFREFNKANYKSGHDLPDYFDWRDFGKVTRAKDQAKCNCCYAFTVIATIESVVAIRDNLTADGLQNSSSLSLSEQQIVDCSGGGKYQNNGCDYGYIDDTFQYVIDNGVVSETDYPYSGQTKTCKETNPGSERKWIRNFIGLPVRSADQIKRIILSNGPVVAPINNDGLDFLYYDHGIIKTESNEEEEEASTNFFNHAVVIVGWGQKNGTNYWIIKNSWSENWGENGFARIGFGVRGVDKYIYYPLLDDINTDIYNNILIFALAIVMFIVIIATLVYCCDRRGKLNPFPKFKP